MTNDEAFEKFTECAVEVLQVPADKVTREARFAEMIAKGFDPDTYVYGQCRDTVEAVRDKMPVYMGVGVDAPRSRAEQAVCEVRVREHRHEAEQRDVGDGVGHLSLLGFDHRPDRNCRRHAAADFRPWSTSRIPAMIRLRSGKT